MTHHKETLISQIKLYNRNYKVNNKLNDFLCYKIQNITKMQMIKKKSICFKNKDQ